MADVFISYSRKDIAFARILHQALEENGFEDWIDWQDIPPTVEFMKEIYEAIEQADTFIFIISQTSVESETCSLEISHAVKNNKRLIPIVIDETDPGKVTPELAALNWLYFRRKDKFSQPFQDLIEAIQTDYAWVKAHTRLQVRALEWEYKEHDKGFLLRSGDLEEAEEWLAQTPGKDPRPTALQKEYIAASQGAATRRKRIAAVVTTISIILIIAATLTIVLLQARANRQREEARRAEIEQQLAADLIGAVQFGDLDAVKEALEAGADVNARDIYGSTLLHIAAYCCQIEIAEFLIEAGADVNARDDEGDTPLHEAAHYGHIEMVALLLDKGADMNARNNYAATPLQDAISESQTETAEFIRQHGGVE
jgi:hypothetical protein